MFRHFADIFQLMGLLRAAKRAVLRAGLSQRYSECRIRGREAELFILRSIAVAQQAQNAEIFSIKMT